VAYSANQTCDSHAGMVSYTAVFRYGTLSTLFTFILYSHCYCSACVLSCGFLCVLAKTEAMAELHTPIKQDFMVKRSMNRSWWRKVENLKSRWFLLTKNYLYYCEGNIQVGFFQSVFSVFNYTLSQRILLLSAGWDMNGIL